MEENVKERIRRLAREKGSSITKIESICGLSNGTIGKWDKSKPSFDNALKVADALEVSMEYLMTGVDSADSAPTPREIDELAAKADFWRVEREKFKQKAIADIKKESPEKISGLTDREDLLIKMFRKLELPYKRIILSSVLSFLEEQEEF